MGDFKREKAMTADKKMKAMINKVLILGCIGSLLVLASMAIAKEKQKGISRGDYSGYNVLLVSFDALQAAHVGHLGYSRNTTPTIDRIAKEGFSFKNAISQSSWTVPASMTWFTSAYPSEHKCINKYSTYTENEKILTDLKKLAPNIVTLAEVLKKHGYVTAGFTGDAGVGGHFGFAQGFDVYVDGQKFSGMEQSAPNAENWLRKNYKKKFFLFLHGYDSHGQYDPPGGFTRRFVDFDYKGPLVGGKQEQERLREEGLDKGSISLTDDDVRFWRALYDEKINDADSRFAKFLEEFEKLGLMDKTIIILVSDHGTEFYEHKRFDHGFSLYDELIHTLFVLRLPKAKESGILEDQVRGLDVMPTLLDLLGIKPTKKLSAQERGVSLIPLLNGAHLQLDAFSETDYRFCVSKRSLRTVDGWKFIYNLENGNRELYNIKTDPAELDNKIDKEPRIAYELEQKLFGWLKSMGQDENYFKKMLANVLRIKEY